MAVPAPLGYETRQPRRGGIIPLLFVGAVAGALYFRFADFHAYVDTGQQRWPKFEMPLWWQIGESCIVAVFVALAAGSLRKFVHLIRSQ
jgi:hypothetical protein